MIMKKHLDFIRSIKSVAFATADNNQPFVRFADVMLVEEDKLYFLVGRGKSFYRQLKKNPILALAGMDATYKSIRITGKVEFVDREWIDRIFEANPMMNDLYPNEKRDVLDAYCMTSGVGDIFDLSVVPPERERFAFGGALLQPVGYHINDNCIACGVCAERCPEKCIDQKGENYYIQTENCLECGRCLEGCDYNAIEAAKVFGEV